MSDPQTTPLGLRLFWITWFLVGLAYLGLAFALAGCRAGDFCGQCDEQTAHQ